MCNCDAGADLSLVAGKRDIARLSAVLERDYSTVEEAAQAAMAEAWAIADEKGRFSVVGQLRYGRDGYIDPEDSAACKVSLGRYSTQKQAHAAAESLVFSHRTGEEFRAWVLPTFSGSPASYFAERVAERKKAEIGRGQGLEARLQKRQEFFAANPGVLVLPDDIDDDTERCNTCGHELATIEGN